MESRKSFLLRIDPALMTELESWAQDELRSVNGQIEYLLRQAVMRRRKSAAARLPSSAHSSPARASKEGI